MANFASRWFGSGQPDPVDPYVPDQQRVYCIGDIHGRLDLLQTLHEIISEDGDDFSGEKTLVYVGDYIDRGERSKGVIDLLIDSPLDGFNSVYLMGNHEQSLLDFLDHPRALAGWLSWGGRETLQSYGVAAPIMPSRDDLDGLRQHLANNLPQSHLDFFKKLELMHELGNYCFVHAGIRPGIPMPEQRNEDLLWIREDFTQSNTIHDKIVVHGHTITKEVELLPNRIGIDTGAYATGILTCLVLEGKTQRLLQTNVGASIARDDDPVGSNHAGEQDGV